MAPAEVSMVIVDEDKRSLMVVVPDDQLSLAIGRQGQNVRLASKLLDWKIDVKSEARYAKLEEDGYKSLLNIEGVNEALADILYDSGFASASELKDVSAAELEELKSIELEQAEELVTAVANYLESAEIEEEEALQTADDESSAEVLPEKPVSKSAKVKVYELAKEAGMKSKELAEKLIELGYDIKGYSSSVDSETAEKIRQEVLGL
jgi:N utilization substance protein A